MSLQQVLLHFGNLPKNLNGDSENTMKTEKQTYDKDALNDLRDLFGGIQSKYLFILGKWLIRCHQNIVITGKKGCGKKKLLNAIYLEALSEIKEYPNSNVRLCIVDSVDDIKGTSILLGCIRPDKNEMFIFTHSATTPKAFLKLLNWKIGLAYGKIFPRNYTDVILQLVKFEIHIDIVGNSRLISRVNEYILNDDGVIERYYIVNKRRGYNGYVNFDKDAQNISFKKVVNGIECEYYVRIFSRVPNFKFASGGTSEYDLYGEDNGLLKEYQDPKYDFESHVSRLAFAKNIYSDDIGEIVYTDDIDISNLKDNLGRPLSSVYLTLVKNNKGYKQWYGFTNSADTWDVSEVSGDSIEYSHCFGKITCAFDCCEESARDYRILNIKSINNNGMNIGYDCNLINGEREWGYDDKDIYHIDAQEIWYDYDTSYYGDLSYYDAFNAVERHIQPMLHRFNTAQRESNKSESTEYFNTYIYDEIKNDDYDKNDKYEIKTNTEKNVNNHNEGYYYVPHYEIPIKTFSTINSVMPMFLNIRSLVNTSNGTRITVLEKHFLGVGDKAMIYDTETDELYYCVTISGDNDKVFVCNIYDEEGNKTDRIPDLFASSDNLLRYRLFKIDNLNIPSYAHIIRDGTCRFIWRDIINNGMNPSDKTIEEYPFTNGAFYINKRVNLYLKRQDPYDLYGLYSDDDILGREAKIENENNYVKEKDIVC